jgi:hypothetical protein
MSPAARRAWVASAVSSAVLLVVGGVIGALVRDAVDAWPVLIVPWPVVGALVVARRPESLVGRCWS